MPHHPLTLEPDRELVLVPKKGRPVTQCQHCRIERKKRSAHVKCDCGEVEKPHHPKEKCIHLREAEERIKQGLPAEPSEDKSKEHLAFVAEEQGCCCHHGGKCSCATKKDEHDGSLPHAKPAVQKPRLDTTKSDGHITVFANGHHKPVHRKNNAAHESSMPYKLPMPRSHTTETMATRRSVDDMGLNQNSSLSMAGDGSSIGIPFDTGRRKSKSEQTSPKLPPLNTNNAWTSAFGAPSSLPQPEFEFSGMQGANDFAVAFGCPSFSYTTDNGFGPGSGNADSQYDPWSALGSGDLAGLANTNPFDMWPNPQDAANLLVQPALTAASSGTHSEVDETPPIDESCGPWHMPSIQEDTGAFDMSDPYLTGMQNNPNRHSLPPSFFGNANLNFLSQPNDAPTSAAAGTKFTPFDTSKPSTSNPFDSHQTSNIPQLDDNSWQPTPLPLLTQMPHRLRQPHNQHQTKSNNYNNNHSRPPARSLGPSNAPTNDVMRELFPELEDDNGLNPASSSAYSPDGLPPISAVSSVPMSQQDSGSGFDYGTGDEGASGGGCGAFTGQPWSTEGLAGLGGGDFVSGGGRGRGFEVEGGFTGQGNGWST